MKMKSTNNNVAKFTGLIVLLIVLVGCQRHWTKANRMGNITEKAFLETIPFEFDSKLIVIPVSIKGKTYRFLYDTGAPFSISKPLQEELRFKEVSKSSIRDSDNNRSQVDWVQVDTLLLGDIPFVNLSAFVGDYQLNPVLACFNLDGIIGSNNIRMCNWYIDYEHKEMHFTNQKADTFGIKGYNVPFEYNSQFTMLLDIKSGPVVLKNMHLDTGSNGDISILANQFDSLAKYNRTNSVYNLKGVKQSGILGQVTPIESSHSQLDSVVMGELIIPNVAIGTSNSKLIGNEILSLYHLVIDSQSKKLIFDKNGIEPEPFSSFGFRPGSNDGTNVYVQSVYSHSKASDGGIVTGMEILSFDSLDFMNKHNICDLIEHNQRAKKENDTAILMVKSINGDTLIYHLKKETFYK